ncbi:hypothetical protein MNBD_ALPHA12-810 [hydrothermal vent metagenome]|uniref:Transcriptional regulator, Crp/Fnr family n=1 Tax=hydrothermal vent metagenome TaxID=652676 RepID=A0A3B0TI67_9ZZZZ
MGFMACGNKRCFPDHLVAATEWRVLDRKELDWLGSIAVCNTYEPGQCLFYEGDECKGIHFVCQGLVGVRRLGVNGDSVLIRLAKQGDPLAFWTFLTGNCHKSSAEVLQPTRACFLNSSCLREVFDRNPALSHEFLRRASRDLGEAQERFHQTVTLDLRSRLAHFLLAMKKRYGRVTDEGKLLIELPISRRDMAEMIGVRTESLSRTIRKMTDDGVLTFSGHRVWLNDVDLLASEIERFEEADSCACPHRLDPVYCGT